MRDRYQNYLSNLWLTAGQRPMSDRSMAAASIMDRILTSRQQPMDLGVVNGAWMRPRWAQRPTVLQGHTPAVLGGDVARGEMQAFGGSPGAAIGQAPMGSPQAGNFSLLIRSVLGGGGYG